MENEEPKKSLFERAKGWIALVMSKPKTPAIGIWFNAKKKKQLPSKEEIKELLDVAAPLLQEALNGRGVAIPHDGMVTWGSNTAQCLYDWLSYSGPIGGHRGQIQNGAPINEATPIGTTPPWGTVVEDETVPKRIAAKPVDVRKELESEPAPWTMEGLEDKITLLKRKGSITTQHYSKQELDSLVERLENRKKYEQFKEFFGQFPNTTDVLIDALVTKYKLEMKSSDLFVPEFPKEAIDVMEEYSAKVKELCGKNPVYYVIAEEGDFKKKYEKRDPILLVQSPFGFYFQILGAWDAEMLILHEL